MKKYPLRRISAVRKMVFIFLIFFASFERAQAVPSLIPLASLIGLVVAKIFMALGAAFFFLRSLLKKGSNKFIVLGIILLAAAIFLFVYF